MTTDPASLDNLRDIVEPSPVPWWPPAPGWWVLFVVAVTAAGYGLYRTCRTWRRNAYRPAKLNDVMRREFGSGVHANVDAMARIGYLYLREGRWQDQQVIPAGFVKQARTTVKGVVGLPEHDPMFRIDGQDLTFLRSIGIDPTRRMRRRR